MGKRPKWQHHDQPGTAFQTKDMENMKRGKQADNVYEEIEMSPGKIKQQASEDIILKKAV